MYHKTLSNLYLELRSKMYSSERIYQVRDLTKINLQGDFALIIAVDSDGGIGPLQGDTIYCPAYQLGRFAIRVPLLEILSAGATPVAAFDMLTTKMEGVGAEIIAGIRDELKDAGLPETFPLSGSTEDNVPTIMTGIGTVIIGLVKQQDFRPGSSQPSDLILCIGKPKSAPEDTVRQDDSEIVHHKDVINLLKIDGVHDILPVGSHGVAFEANQLAQTAGLTFYSATNVAINLTKSGGPSTCVLVSCHEKAFEEIKQKIRVPTFLLGKLSE